MFADARNIPGAWRREEICQTGDGVTLPRSPMTYIREAMERPTLQATVEACNAPNRGVPLPLHVFLDRSRVRLPRRRRSRRPPLRVLACHARPADRRRGEAVRALMCFSWATLFSSQRLTLSPP